MKLWLLLVVFTYIGGISAENVTKFERKNIFLSRRKRYVQWPKGSNFVINLTCSKPLLRYQPLTWNTVYEMDFPFAVLSDNRMFFGKGATRTKRHVVERKELYEHLEDFTTSMGLNGRACVNRLLCESEEFIQTNEQSMFKDIIKLIFRSFLNHEEFAEYNDKCEEEDFTSCPLSLLGIFINSSNNEENTFAPINNYQTFDK